MAGETIRDAVIRIRIEQLDKELKVETSTAGKTVEEFGKKSAKAMGEGEKAAREAEARQKQLNKEYEQSIRDVEEFGKKQIAENLKAADSFRTLGEGVFTVARGITLLGLAGEEDVNKLVEGVAQAQATFDLFKGSLDILKGLSEGIEAVRAAQDAAKASTAAAATVQQLKTAVTIESTTASSAAAAAGTAQAAANTAVGTTATGAAAGMTALQVATGPVGVAFLAVAAAVAGLVFYLNSLNDEEERNARIEQDAANRRRRLADETERLKRVSQSAAEQERFLSPGDAQQSRQQRLNSTVNTLRDATQNRREIEQQVAARRQQLELLRELQDLDNRSGRSAEEIKRFNQLRSQLNVDGAFGRFSGISGTVSSRISTAETELSGSQGELVAARQRELQLLEQKKKLTEDISRADIRTLENRRAELEAQKALVSETRAEARERYQLAAQLRSQEESLQLQLLNLKGADRSRAIRDIKTLTSGSSSERDKLRATERLGTAGINLAEGNAARLREAERLGLDDVTGLTSLRSERDKALREGDAAAERATQASIDIAKKVREVESKIADSNQKLSEMMGTILGSILSQSDRIIALERDVAKLETNLKNNT